MSDITQGQDAPSSDNELFRDAVDTPTLEKFENPELPEPGPKPAEKPVADKPADKPADQDRENIPAFRLREEAEARRRVEQERDDLRARLERLERAAPRQQQEPVKLDIFENPNGFIRQEMQPLLDDVRNDFQRRLEGLSLENAVVRYGQEKVVAARTALEQGLRLGNPDAQAAYRRAMEGHDPYGTISRWHQERETIGVIGGDLDAYKKKLLDEALNDPEYQKRVIEATRGKALASGQSVNRPAPSKVPTTPSLANFGAGGGDEQVIEPSDDQLFRQAVSAKRR